MEPCRTILSTSSPVLKLSFPCTLSLRPTVMVRTTTLDKKVQRCGSRRSWPQAFEVDILVVTTANAPPHPIPFCHPPEHRDKELPPSHKALAHPQRTP
jgi:hypothetical protein